MSLAPLSSGSKGRQPNITLSLSSPLVLLAFFFSLSLFQTTLAQVGQPCSQSNNRLTFDTNQFRSDCGYTAWCDTDGICKPNGCRKDDFPFGYRSRKDWPPLCPRGQVCPDELSACVPQQALGQACQLNRDDQCQPSYSTSPKIKSICLKFQCQLTNSTLGSPCTIENTVYTVFVGVARSYAEIISRDNCLADLYCDAGSSTCLTKKPDGQSCSAHKECESGYCRDDSLPVGSAINNDATGRCDMALSVVRRPPIWKYIVVVVGILAGCSASCFALLELHARGRRKRRMELREYKTRMDLLGLSSDRNPSEGFGKEKQSQLGTGQSQDDLATKRQSDSSYLLSTTGGSSTGLVKNAALPGELNRKFLSDDSTRTSLGGSIYQDALTESVAQHRSLPFSSGSNLRLRSAAVAYGEREDEVVGDPLGVAEVGLAAGQAEHEIDADGGWRDDLIESYQRPD